MGRKGSRYTPEEKLFYIGLVQEEGWSARKVQRVHGIKHKQVAQWLERYEATSFDGLEHGWASQHYSENFKLEVVQKYLVGERIVLGASPRIWDF